MDIGYTWLAYLFLTDLLLLEFLVEKTLGFSSIGKWSRLVGVGVGTAILMVLAGIGASVVTIQSVLCASVCAFAGIFGMGSAIKRLLAAALFFSACTLAGLLAALIRTTLARIAWLGERIPSVERLFPCLAYIFVICMTVLWLSRQINPVFSLPRGTLRWSTAALVCLFICSWWLSIWGNAAIRSARANDPWIIFLPISAALILLLLFAIGKMGELYARGKQTSSKVSELEHAYASLTSLTQTVRAQHHEFRHHLTAMRALAHESGWEQLTQYLDGLAKDITTAPVTIHSGNPVLDALVSGAQERARRAGIAMSVQADRLPIMSIPQTDMAIIVSNLLENALEAAQLCRQNAFIRFEVLNKSGMVVLIAENSANIDYIYENGHLASSKGRSKSHGLGLRNVEQVTASAGGFIHVQPGEKTFRAEVWLPAAHLRQSGEWEPIRAADRRETLARF